MMKFLLTVLIILTVNFSLISAVYANDKFVDQNENIDLKQEKDTLAEDLLMEATPNNDPQVITSKKKKLIKKGRIGLPSDPVTQDLDFPMPSNTTLINVVGYINQYKALFAKYSDVRNEVTTYIVTLDKKLESNAPEIENLKTRIKEDFMRAHWVYIISIGELLEYLTDNKSIKLQHKTEKEFIRRFKSISFLAKNLQEVTNKEKYFTYAQKLYVYTNRNFFDRYLKNKKELP